MVFSVLSWCSQGERLDGGNHLADGFIGKRAGAASEVVS